MNTLFVSVIANDESFIHKTNETITDEETEHQSVAGERQRCNITRKSTL